MRVLHSSTQAFCTFRQGCIAGSHRPGAPLPTHDGWQKSWATPELRGAEWPADVDVHRVSVNAGDASKALACLLAHACVASLAHGYLRCCCPVLFSEKLMHGTLPWTAPGRERRSLFYKYVRTPACSRSILLRKPGDELGFH